MQKSKKEVKTERKFSKKIGSTMYTLAIHFSSISEEDNLEEYISSETERKYIIVFVVSFILALLLTIIPNASRTIRVRHSDIISMLVMICHLVALVTIVTSYIKYPKNRTIAILFWVYVGMSVLVFIVSAIMLIACINSCWNCAWRAYV
jgi:uncharacterized membrane protein YhaH (DUF805 family)